MIAGAICEETDCTGLVWLLLAALAALVAIVVVVSVALDGGGVGDPRTSWMAASPAAHRRRRLRGRSGVAPGHRCTGTVGHRCRHRLGGGTDVDTGGDLAAVDHAPLAWSDAAGSVEPVFDRIADEVAAA